MYDIDPDIRRAQTLPGTFYNDPVVFERIKESLFARSWQMITGAEDQVKLPLDALPFRFMDGFIDEPLLLLRDAQGALNCLSNVCTHRGKIIVENPGKLDRGLVCGYHGRRFQLDGSFMSMPETQDMENFPCTDDNLTQLPIKQWRQFLFTSFDPIIPFEEWVEGLERKVGFLPVQDFRFAASRSRDYLVHANWALYCDNYLEGFHIPFLHKALAQSIDWGSYRTEPDTWGNCQVGVGKSGDVVFDLPKTHEDHGQQIAAYYFWLFPNIMFNFYPWGLSLNMVRPLQQNLTKVSFRAYVWDEKKLGTGAGGDIDLVEREDEAVVEQVQLGTRSRFYKHGRFSPRQERGVHQFHSIISKLI